MKNLILLIKREYWEHKSLIFVPILICLLLILIGCYNSESISLSLSKLWQHHNQSIINLSKEEFLHTLAASILIAANIIICTQAFFYSLNAIFNDKKDGSILFWKSLPITNFQIIFSKLIVAIILLLSPLLISLIVSSFIGSIAGLNFNDIYLSINSTSVFLVKTQIITLIVMFPFIGWGLFISAASNKSPFVVGVLLPLVIYVMLAIFGMGNILRHYIACILYPILHWSSILLHNYLGEGGYFINFFKNIYFWGYIKTGCILFILAIYKYQNYNN